MERILKSTHHNRNCLPNSGGCKVLNETFVVSEIEEEITMLKKEFKHHNITCRIMALFFL